MTTWALVTSVDLDTANLHLAELEAAGLLGIAEEAGRVTAYFPERCEGLPLEGRWEAVPDTDWSRRWKDGIEPVRVGAITVTPPWIDVPGALVIEPAQAFGTGHHETTMACLAALQELPVRDRRVLDVGTGTGILALAAKQLGGADVNAVDTDPVAVETARGNARLNGLRIEVWQGSVEAAPGAFDVVVANLDTATLTRLAPALATALARDGFLVAAGVSNDRVGEAAATLESAGLAVHPRPGREWTLLLARHRRPSAE